MNDKEFLIALGQKIVAYRKSKNLKQIDLAIRCGIGDSALRRIEKGRVNSSINMLRRISGALDIEVHELVKIN